MKLTNLQAFNVWRWLNSPLHGAELVARNDFLKLIKPQFDAFNDSRIDRIKELATKDDKGNPKVSPTGNGYEMTPEADKKLEDYMAESVTYDLAKLKNATLPVIKNLLMTKPAKDLDAAEGLVWQEVYDQL